MLTSEVHGLYTGAEGAGEMAGGRDRKIRERQDENPYRGLRSSPKHTLPPPSPLPWPAEVFLFPACVHFLMFVGKDLRRGSCCPGRSRHRPSPPPHCPVQFPQLRIRALPAPALSGLGPPGCLAGPGSGAALPHSLQPLPASPASARRCDPDGLAAQGSFQNITTSCRPTDGPPGAPSPPPRPRVPTPLRPGLPQSAVPHVPQGSRTCPSTL